MTADDQAFVTAWNASRSRWQVAATLNWPLMRVQSTAQRLRQAGVPLKRFDNFFSKGLRDVASQRQ